jgi:acyl-coenzyme A thioesterase PaaI-like protein
VEESKEYTFCFGCGKDNPIGLKLDMRVTGGLAYADFVPRPEHQSYDDRMHGGLLATLLDEVMGNHVFNISGTPAYTADLHVRFKDSVRIGEPIHIESRFVSRRGRLYIMTGAVTDNEGNTAVTAEAKIMTRP